MKEIPLTQGKVALVDDDDYERLAQFKWGRHTRGYAVRKEMRDGKKVAILMHRVICNAQPGEIVDHIDGDVSNNSKANLRLCSHSENMYNRRLLAKNNTSGYKGVSRKKKGWEARIGAGGRFIHLGCFATPEEAAAQYNLAAITYHGEFARLNDIAR